ncbi:hypothetical protein T03_5558 [Trichinella britovi]|uniref:Uncharacterized protein n=1 Tax=Trichinella britovi TaxID=45882 RepID=A0A0V1CLF7_TRIBR|nr:hypothetical protein T03_5558 [Trichinella britovi]
MVRAHQESLAIKVWPELAQGPYQAEHFFLSRAIPTCCLGQRAPQLFPFSLPSGSALPQDRLL